MKTLISVFYETEKNNREIKSMMCENKNRIKTIADIFRSIEKENKDAIIKCIYFGRIEEL
jgi:hypothetical protein